MSEDSTPATPETGDHPGDAARTGEAPQPTVVAVTEATFRDTVLSSPVPVVVDFWAEWCGPCKQLSPIIDSLAEDYAGDITVAKVDVDSERGLGAAYQIMSIPTVMIFRDGTKVDEFTGYKPKKAIARRIDAVLNP